MRADIGIRAHEDTGVPDEAAQPSDGGRPFARTFQAERPVIEPQDARCRQICEESLPYPDRTCARPSATVRRAERLVDVEMHDVEPCLPGPEPAEDRVQVRSIHVGEGTRL